MRTKSKKFNNLIRNELTKYREAMRNTFQKYRTTINNYFTKKSRSKVKITANNLSKFRNKKGI